MIKRKTNSERREEILDVAMTVLAFEGLASVTMRGIAERVGIKLASLQYYFPSKKELLNAAIEKCIGSVVVQMDELAAKSTQSPEKVLKKILKLHLKISRDPFVSKFFCALWALASHDKDVEKLLNEIYERDCKRYAVFIKNAKPELHIKTCELHAIMIMAQLEGLVLFVTSGRFAEPRLKAIEKKLDLLIDKTVLS